MNLLRLNKESFKNRTKVFSRIKRWKNSLVFFTFILLAFVFWLLIYYQQKFEVELYAPIHYKNIPSNIVLSDSVPDKISLKIQDKGIALLNYFFRKEKNVIEIDLEDISSGENPYVIEHEMLSDIIYEHLSAMTQLTSFEPEQIVVNYFPLKSKNLPVVLTGNVDPAPGYFFVNDLTINPSTIVVYGSPQVLDKLHAINTKQFKQTAIDKKLDVSLDLQIPQGVRLSTHKVQLTAEVEAYTEKTFELPVVSHNLPANLYVRFFPSSVELVCQVALSKYSQLTEKELEISIDYNQLEQNKNALIPLTLSKKPKDLINYRMVPERVEYLIEQKKNL
jgi:hypothetical protein